MLEMVPSGRRGRQSRWTVSMWKLSVPHKMKSMTELAGRELCLLQRPNNCVGGARRRMCLDGLKLPLPSFIWVDEREHLSPCRLVPSLRECYHLSSSTFISYSSLGFCFKKLFIPPYFLYAVLFSSHAYTNRTPFP